MSFNAGVETSAAFFPGRGGGALVMCAVKNILGVLITACLKKTRAIRVAFICDV